MKVSFRLVGAWGLALAASAAAPAWADEAGEVEGPGPAASAPRYRSLPITRVPLGPVAPASLRAPTTPWGIGIVELPPQSVLPGPQRPHHALSFASEPPRRLLHSIGIDASECTTRVRLPTRIRQVGNSISAEVQGQVQLGCRF